MSEIQNSRCGRREYTECMTEVEFLLHKFRGREHCAIIIGRWLMEEARLRLPEHIKGPWAE